MEVLGFEKQKQFFESFFKSPSVSSFLFSGPEMIGKKTFVSYLVQKHGIGSYDIFDVESEEGLISIDVIRKISEFCSHRPVAGSFKAVVINDAHSMNIEAQNALLKILEEPRDSSIIFLVSHQPFLLLDTIRSRCQEIFFHTHPSPISNKFLEETQLNVQQKSFLLDLIDGRIGLLKSILADQSYKTLKESVAQIFAITKSNSADRARLFKTWCDVGSDTHLQKKILLLLLYFRKRLTVLGVGSVLNNLLNFYTLLGQSRYNRKLAEEVCALSL